jgi:hypothetical protein
MACGVCCAFAGLLAWGVLAQAMTQPGALTGAPSDWQLARVRSAASVAESCYAECVPCKINTVWEKEDARSDVLGAISVVCVCDDAHIVVYGVCGCSSLKRDQQANMQAICVHADVDVCLGPLLQFTTSGSAFVAVLISIV